MISARLYLILALAMTFAFPSCQAQTHDENRSKITSATFINEAGDTIYRIVKSEEEWARELDDQAFYVMRKEGTERAFTGEHWDNKEPGVYTCAGCGLPLFDSETKYKSGTGWPSFYAPLDKTHVGRESDKSLGMLRTEVHCSRCGGHLGHVFDDGPKPTGLRYCINSVSLDFVPRN